MNRRTPGPWSISFKNNTVVGPERDDGNRLVICEMGGSLDNPSALADAALVAAAPELLHELEHLARLLEPALNNGQAQVPGLATVNGAWLAIAKARGQQLTSDTQD